MTKQPAPPDFRPPDWVPLKDAFNRIQRSLGSSDLASRKLHQALLSGQLKSGVLRLPPVGSGQHFVIPVNDEQRLVLSPGFWAQASGFTYEDGAVRTWSKGGRQFSGRWYFFVFRSDLDRLYPMAGKPDETKSSPRRRPGPVTTHDWHAIDGEIARRCIDPKSRRLQVPKNESKLASAMLEWCQTQFGREPAESEMREAVRRICAALRQV